MKEILYFIPFLFACNYNVKEKKETAKPIQAYEIPFCFGKALFTVENNKDIEIVGQTIEKDIPICWSLRKESYWYLVKKNEQYGWVFGDSLKIDSNKAIEKSSKQLVGNKYNISWRWSDFKEGNINSGNTLFFYNDSMCIWHDKKAHYGDNLFKELFQVGKYKVNKNKILIELTGFFLENLKVQKGNTLVDVEFDIVLYKNNNFLTHNGEKRVYFSGINQKIDKKDSTFINSCLVLLKPSR